MIKKIMLKYANPDCNSVSVKKKCTLLNFPCKRGKKGPPGRPFYRPKLAIFSKILK